MGGADLDIIKTRSDDVRILLKKLKADYESRLRDKNKIISALETDTNRLKKINSVYASERRNVLEMLNNSNK